MTDSRGPRSVFSGETNISRRRFVWAAGAAGAAAGVTGCLEGGGADTGDNTNNGNGNSENDQNNTSDHGVESSDNYRFTDTTTHITPSSGTLFYATGEMLSLVDASNSGFPESTMEREIGVDPGEAKEVIYGPDAKGVKEEVVNGISTDRIVSALEENGYERDGIIELGGEKHEIHSKGDTRVGIKDDLAYFAPDGFLRDMMRKTDLDIPFNEDRERLNRVYDKLIDEIGLSNVQEYETDDPVYMFTSFKGSREMLGLGQRAASEEGIDDLERYAVSIDSEGNIEEIQSQTLI